MSMHPTFHSLMRRCARGILLPLIAAFTIVALLLPAGIALAAPANLDTSWGGDGTVQSDLSGSQNDMSIQSLMQPDGKVIVVGMYKDTPSQFAAVRYNANGTL